MLREWRVAVVLTVAYMTVMTTYKMPLLQLPYYGDGLGTHARVAHEMRDNRFYPIPINEDVVDGGHPPLLGLLMASLWAVTESQPLMTHWLMQLISSVTIVFTYLIGHATSRDHGVGLAAALTVAVTPLFFFGSSLPQTDTLATALTAVALYMAIRGRWLAFAFWGSLTVMAKETAVLLVLAVAAWIVCARGGAKAEADRGRLTWLFGVTAPVAVLALWFGFHWVATGHVYSNASQYPGGMTESVLLGERLRDPILLMKRFGIRVIQLAITDFKWLGLLIICAAVVKSGMHTMRSRERHPGRPGRRAERLRDWITAFATTPHALLCLVILAYLALLAAAGFLNPRYLLPVTPAFFALVALAARCLSTSRAVFAAVIATVVVLSFLTHSTKSDRFGTPEDNYEYADIVRVHHEAAAFLEAHYLGKTVVTTYPGTFILRLPYLGYVSQPLRAVDVRQIDRARLRAGEYDLLWHIPDDSSSALLEDVVRWLRPPLLRHFEVNGKWTAIYVLGNAAGR